MTARIPNQPPNETAKVLFTPRTENPGGPVSRPGSGSILLSAWVGFLQKLPCRSLCLRQRTQLVKLLTKTKLDRPKNPHYTPTIRTRLTSEPPDKDS
jgi:hypothetical protein